MIYAIIAGVVVLVLVLAARRAGTEAPKVDLAPPNDEVRAHLAAGRKIQAIKAYREQTGAGLKDAKDAVEALED